MSRIRFLPMSEAGWFTRLADWLLRKRAPSHTPHSAAAIYGHHPAVLASFLGFGAGYTRWNSLPERLKRLVHLRTALRIGCPS